MGFAWSRSSSLFIIRTGVINKFNLLLAHYTKEISERNWKCGANAQSNGFKSVALWLLSHQKPRTHRFIDYCVFSQFIRLHSICWPMNMMMVWWWNDRPQCERKFLSASFVCLSHTMLRSRRASQIYCNSFCWCVCFAAFSHHSSFGPAFVLRPFFAFSLCESILFFRFTLTDGRNRKLAIELTHSIWKYWMRPQNCYSHRKLRFNQTTNWRKI